MRAPKCVPAAKPGLCRLFVAQSRSLSWSRACGGVYGQESARKRKHFSEKTKEKGVVGTDAESGAGSFKWGF